MVNWYVNFWCTGSGESALLLFVWSTVKSCFPPKKRSFCLGLLIDCFGRLVASLLITLPVLRYGVVRWLKVNYFASCGVWFTCQYLRQEKEFPVALINFFDHLCVYCDSLSDSVPPLSRYEPGWGWAWAMAERGAVCRWPEPRPGRLGKTRFFLNQPSGFFWFFYIYLPRRERF